MEKKDIRIVFMGTPDFAVESLRGLVENGYNVVGVVTMPDKPSGRGHKLQYSAVKCYAIEHNLSILQPEKLKDESFLNDLHNLKADLQIVVAFRMLPEVVWNMPPMGTFNLHGSLLPQYRGAAPINWAIINGEKETGVTTFFLTHEIDTGKIILQDRVAIGQDDNVGKIYNELMTLGSKLVQKTVDLILVDKVDAMPQELFLVDKPNLELKSAPKIFKETCRINWNQSTENLHNFVRGLSPYPAAWTMLHQAEEEPVSIKIFSARKVVLTDVKKSGTIDTDNKTYLKVFCADGILDIKEIQLPGKKAMQIEDLLRGYKFKENSYFE